MSSTHASTDGTRLCLPRSLPAVAFWGRVVEPPPEAPGRTVHPPDDRDDEADPDDLADSLSELPEARLVAAPGRLREVLASDDPPPTSAAEVLRAGPRAGLVYPEWDYRAGAYHARGAVVHERTRPLGDAAWAEGVLARRAGLLHAVRRRFERLRPRRQRLGRQLDGAEVDLAAYVAAYADRRAGCPADDRLYEAVRPARRDIAIALLVDVSGSTDSWVTEDLCVVDVEKEALLVLSDGKPNDVDRYEGRYGVEDARQAVVEARLQEIHPFCVTVDRHAPAYMPRIFGAGGYAALHHPEHLPTVLVDVLRRLVRA